LVSEALESGLPAPSNLEFLVAVSPPTFDGGFGSYCLST
jgi:hypothetical protein